MIRKIYLIVLLLLISAIGTLMLWSLKSHKEFSKFKSKTFQIENGWGYDILINDKIYIHQENIPAVKGKQFFQSKSEAGKTATLVVEKLKKRQLPLVKIAELDSLKIRYRAINNW
jgi:hypothetical protein